MSVDLIPIGDQLQSSASRMAEWVLSSRATNVPYEVRMAALEAEDAVADWTEVRRTPPAPEPARCVCGALDSPNHRVMCWQAVRP